MRRLIVAFTAVVLLSLAVAATAGSGDASRPPKIVGFSSASRPAIEKGAAEAGATVARAAAYVGVLRVEEAVAEIQRRIGEYAAAVAQAEFTAALARAAAFVRSQYRPPAPVSRSAPSVGSTVGSCTGFVIPDYIIQRESGGNPSAYNPSGAYGCAQTLLSHYGAGGPCGGLDPYTIQGQRDCVYRLSNGGTNLAPWAATR